MKGFFSFFAILGMLYHNPAFCKVYDFYNHDDTLGKQEYHEHRGLRVYFYTPVHGSDVNKVVAGSQGVWTAKEGQTLTKVVGFFRCMGFGLSHVSYYDKDGKTNEVLLGYNHGQDDLEVVDKTKFYNKLLSYTVKNEKLNPDVPGHPVLHQLEYYLKKGVETVDELVKEEVKAAKEKAAAPKDVKPEEEEYEVEEVHTEL